MENNLVELEWKRKKNSTNVALHDRGAIHLKFKIVGLGGHITTRRYWLAVMTVASGGQTETILELRFSKLRDAKLWAEQFVNSGAWVNPHMFYGLYS